MPDSDVLRKCWWNLSSNGRTIFRVLYDAQDDVPGEELQGLLYSELAYVLGWIGRSIAEAGGGYHPSSTFFEGSYYRGYRLKNHWRPVVGELLWHHGKEKTIILESLWSMTDTVKSLECCSGDIPGDIPADFAMRFKSCQQELELLLEDLLKLSNANPA